MRKIKRLNILLVLLILTVTLLACSNKKNETVYLEIWHYYNGAQKIAFDKLLVEFNESLGLEKGIIVEAVSYGDIGQLEESIIESIDQKPGAGETPDIVASYSDMAYELDQRGLLVNLEDYIAKEEMEEYIDFYIEEGRLGKDNQLKIFPTAKATEIMMVNKTDWDKFEAATDAKTEDLSTWEGLARTAELYYDWTDSLTEEKNDGKAFFGRDALANYILVGAKQLEQEIFEAKEDEVILNLDQDVMRRLWDNYYIPYISGYYTSYGRFSSDDAKTGEIIALVGSTTGAAYFPDKVSIGESNSYDIDVMVLPLPNFEDSGLNAVQQGAGMLALESDQIHEQACVEFLKWFTDESRNLEFSIETGYLPVKKAAYDQEKLEKELVDKKGKGLSKQLQLTIPLAMEQIERYDLYVNRAFKEGVAARSIINSALDDKAKEDRAKVIELMDKGIEQEEAIEEFIVDENFEEWFLDLEKSLLEVIKDEK